MPLPPPAAIVRNNERAASIRKASKDLSEQIRFVPPPPPKNGPRPDSADSAQHSNSGRRGPRPLAPEVAHLRDVKHQNMPSNFRPDFEKIDYRIKPEGGHPTRSNNLDHLNLHYNDNPSRTIPFFQLNIEGHVSRPTSPRDLPGYREYVPLTVKESLALRPPHANPSLPGGPDCQGLSTLARSAAYSIGQKRVSGVVTRGRSPSPQDYDLKDAGLRNNPRPVIGKSKDAPKNLYEACVGKYNPNYNASSALKNHARATFGYEIREACRPAAMTVKRRSLAESLYEQENLYNAADGAYRLCAREPASHYLNGQAVSRMNVNEYYLKMDTLAKHHEHLCPHLTPGVSMKGCSAGTAGSKAAMRSASTPRHLGPGSYAPKQTGYRGPTWTLGTTPRKLSESLTGKDTPGPATYATAANTAVLGNAHAVINRNPKFTMVPFREPTRLGSDRNPGPGHYGGNWSTLGYS